MAGGVGRRVARLVALSVIALVAAACSSNGGAGSTTSAPTSTRSTSGSGSPSGTSGSGGGTAPSNTVWLCRPGMANDPCALSLRARSVPASGSASVTTASDAASPAVDCFYVYPTVSAETTVNANLVVQPTEIAAAETQASRFSQVCSVWAPMYRQVTSIGLASSGALEHAHSAPEQLAYESMLSGWKDFLAHHSDGRPFVLIGHSQGAALLIDLVRSQIDPDPALRSRLVSAIILGGNVEVPVGKDVGGSFQHVPACQSATEVHCVIAYSSFFGEPPSDTYFGRPGQGVSLQSNQVATAGLQVLCVNPAAPSGGTGPLEPYFFTGRSGTPWVTYPDRYSATCESQGGATWLQITPRPGDSRPVVTEALGPKWGLHLDDVNLAYGNLVSLVRSEIAAYHS